MPCHTFVMWCSIVAKGIRKSVDQKRPLARRVSTDPKHDSTATAVNGLIHSQPNAWPLLGRLLKPARKPSRAGTRGSETRLPPYRAPSWLLGGHAQTIHPFLLRGPKVSYRRERIRTPDGDFWDLDWMDPPIAAETAANSARPLVILFHGLEGGSGSHYARALMVHLASIGWRGVIPHFRGHPRAHHSGDYLEVAAMLTAIEERVGGNLSAAPRYAVGVSLGGSVLLNWLGRAGRNAAPLISAAAAVSAPLDLVASGLAIDRGLNRVYSYHILSALRSKTFLIAERFPGLLDLERVRRARTMCEFDEAVTAPLHGFSGTHDYWRQASSLPWLRKIAIPTLVLNARNDPLIPAASLPRQDDVAPQVLLEQPETGGHVGFPTRPFPGGLGWLPQRLVQFFMHAT
jgi:predicted alpha/beta-fold hydrolase